MPLLAYNKTGAGVLLAAGNPAQTLPASASPPARGAAFNVTSELRPDATADPANGVTGGLAIADFALLEAQVVAGDVEFVWTGDPEYLTPGLTITSLGPSGARIQSFRKTISTDDLTAGAVTEAIALTGFPTNVFTLAAWVELDTEFSGGGSSSCTVQVGDAGDPDELMTATDVFTGAGAGQKSAAGTLHGALTFEAAYAPEALVTSDVNVSLLTAGSMVIHVLYIALSLSTA